MSLGQDHGQRIEAGIEAAPMTEWRSEPQTTLGQA